MEYRVVQAENSEELIKQIHRMAGAGWILVSTCVPFYQRVVAEGGDQLQGIILAIFEKDRSHAE